MCASGIKRVANFNGRSINVIKISRKTNSFKPEHMLSQAIELKPGEERKKIAVLKTKLEVYLKKLK